MVYLLPAISTTVSLGFLSPLVLVPLSIIFLMLNGWCTPRTLKRLRSQSHFDAIASLTLEDDAGGSSKLLMSPFRYTRRSKALSTSSDGAAYGFPLLQLPPEIAFQIAAKLDAKSMANLSKTCRFLATLCRENSNMLWKGYAEKKWKFESERRDIDWQRYFLEREALEKDGSFSWKAQDFKVKPSARMCHTGTTTPDNNSVVYIGGQSGQTTRFDEIFQFDGKQFTALNPLMQQAGAGPNEMAPKFARHTTVCVGNKLFTFGGFDGLGQYFTLAVFDLSSLLWSYPATKGQTPLLRTNHACTAVGNKMFIYGGNRTENDEYTILDDLHVLDTDTLTWSQPKVTGEIPGPRVAHKLLSIGRKLYLFGGGVWTPKKDWIEKTNKMHVLDTDTMQWTCVKARGTECVRASSFCIPFVYNHWIFIYGGQSLADGVEIGDLVSFDTISLEWHKHTVAASKQNPGARSVGTANFAAGSVWLFGGSGTHSLENSVHRLSHRLFQHAKRPKLSHSTDMYY